MINNVVKKAGKLKAKDGLILLLIVLLIVSLIFVLIYKKQVNERTNVIKNHNFYANQFVQDEINGIKKNINVNVPNEQYVIFADRISEVKGVVYCAYPQTASSQLVKYINELETTMRAYSKVTLDSKAVGNMEDEINDKIAALLNVINEGSKLCNNYVNGTFDVVKSEKELVKGLEAIYDKEMVKFIAIINSN